MLLAQILAWANTRLHYHVQVQGARARVDVLPVRPVSKVCQTYLAMKSTKMLLNPRLGIYQAKRTQGCSKVSRPSRTPSNVVKTREKQQIQESEDLDFEEEKM